MRAVALRRDPCTSCNLDRVDSQGQINLKESYRTARRLLEPSLRRFAEAARASNYNICHSAADSSPKVASRLNVFHRIKEAAKMYRNTPSISPSEPVQNLCTRHMRSCR